jgi:hypothetical protein
MSCLLVYAADVQINFHPKAQVPSSTRHTQPANRLLKKPGNGPKRHTGRDEVEIRYPVSYCFFGIPDSRFAPSGMTDLMLALKILSFSATC